MIILEMLRSKGKKPEITPGDDITTWSLNRSECIIEENGLYSEFGISEESSLDRELLRDCLAERSLGLHAEFQHSVGRDAIALTTDLRRKRLAFEIEDTVKTKYTDLEDKIHARTIIAAANLFFFYLRISPRDTFGDLAMRPLPSYLEQWRSQWQEKL